MCTWRTGAGSVEDVFCQTFTAGMPGIGEVRSVALAPGGEDIFVTEANRREYVEAYVEFYLTRSVHHQFEVRHGAGSLVVPKLAQFVCCHMRTFNLYDHFIIA